MAKKRTAKKPSTRRTPTGTPQAIAEPMAVPGQGVHRTTMKRGRIRVREFQRVQPDGENDLRVWMVVGLVNMLEPWLGSTLDGEQIAELMARPNVDVEFTLDS